MGDDIRKRCAPQGAEEPESKRHAHIVSEPNTSASDSAFNSAFSADSAEFARAKNAAASNDGLCVNSIRCLAAALPYKANSGHPGAPIGCAAIAHVLFGEFLKFSPSNPQWLARDRFVLSNGHACALHYSMLYLLGSPSMSLDELKKFRQLDSLTPGHPECHETAGVEVTTGPLGQGIAQAVGLAIGQQVIANDFGEVFTLENQDRLLENYTYVLCGDGCLQEGVSSEAMSLAGHLKLGKLIVFYDANKISIDGSTDLSFTEDVGARCASYGWQVLTVEDANTDCDALRQAIKDAQRETQRPTMIICITVIGFGSILEGTSKVHGSPLPESSLVALRQNFNLPTTDLFGVVDEALEFYRARGKKCDEQYQLWQNNVDRIVLKYTKTVDNTNPEIETGVETEIETGVETETELESKIESVKRFVNAGSISNDLMKQMDHWVEELHQSKSDATRNSSEKILNKLYDFVPEIIGGSADLKESNKTNIVKMEAFTGGEESKRNARYIYYGVREHAMIAVCNGLCCFSKSHFKPFGATFLNFVTYGWGALRMAALSKLPILIIATHDSIDLGEDGPTHQPVEVPALIRATPNMFFIRPADGTETLGAYKIWIQQSETPVVLSLSRGNCLQLPNSSLQGVSKGAYIIQDFQHPINDQENVQERVTLAASGTEVQRALKVSQLLSANHQPKIDCRVVSMPCWELFRAQSEDYQTSVIPPPQKSLNIYIEASINFGWSEFFNSKFSAGMTSFGKSAPAAQLYKDFGFDPADLQAKILSNFSRRSN